MNAQDFRSLQEAYLDVYEEKGDIKDKDEKASKQKADARMSGTKAITTYQSSAGYISKGEGEQRLNTVKKKINKELEKRKEKVGNRNLTFSRTKGDDALKMGKSPRNQKEEVDLYDIILSHLLDEGYAETPEAAEAIMVNMSEDWREDICEGYKKFPYKKVEDKIHKKEADNPTGRGTPQSVKMDKVFRHFKGEVRRTERRENSPKISKSKESENKARETQKG